MNLGAGAVTAVAMQPRPCDVRVYQNPLSQAAPTRDKSDFYINQNKITVVDADNKQTSNAFEFETVYEKDVPPATVADASARVALMESARTSSNSSLLAPRSGTLAAI